MNNNNDPNRDLVDFLKQYRPVPPQVDPTLEERLMRQIIDSPSSSSIHRPRRLWVMGGALIAASTLLTWIVVPRLNLNRVSPVLTESEQQEIEEFMLTLWDTETLNSETLTSNWDQSWLSLANFETETSN
ncbi:hypothetical protein K4A83_07325 [Spirulina subsalsa FACHB-351]|uniref:Uncharacterized protein n=1 Tax=Spirulina subsalsa FACHB-351 TaxID=234711 RepID=A0ABT3L3K2_9CYAN|nr:hypothetical protein [Spirulina subsalsa]MCW6036082.1 hypothetical protein [Spirulina subsalsa FACHB-351]